jgi:hypothetical protein
MSVTVIDFNDVEPPRPPRQAHYDIDLIVRRLRDTAESWVPRLFPNGRRVGDEWRLANIHGDAPRKSGSCVISLKGPHAGDWHEFDGEHGGGRSAPSSTPLDSMARRSSLRRPRLLAWLRVCPSARRRQQWQQLQVLGARKTPHRRSPISCQERCRSPVRRSSAISRGGGLWLLKLLTSGSTRT